MAKSKKQSIIEREKNRKGKGTLSKVQLVSVYIAALLIVVLCVVQAASPEEPNPIMYYALAVIAVVYAVFITVRNHKANQADAPTGNRLK